MGRKVKNKPPLLHYVWATQEKVVGRERGTYSFFGLRKRTPPSDAQGSRATDCQLLKIDDRDLSTPKKVIHSKEKKGPRVRCLTPKGVCEKPAILQK